MSFFVYMLISRVNNRQITYVGYTNNLKNRVLLHNSSKGAKFTKGKHWKVIYSKKYPTKSIAMKEEYKLKNNYKLRNRIKSKFFNK